MAQQTAVEWLISQLYISEDSIWFKEIRKQAKEMEKQQMIDFANDLLAQNNTNYIAVPDLAEQYYTETYGNGK
jgi:hypothetical protein